MNLFIRDYKTSIICAQLLNLQAAISGMLTVVSIYCYTCCDV